MTTKPTKALAKRKLAKWENNVRVFVDPRAIKKSLATHAFLPDANHSLCHQLDFDINLYRIYDKSGGRMSRSKTEYHTLVEALPRVAPKHIETEKEWCEACLNWVKWGVFKIEEADLEEAMESADIDPEELTKELKDEAEKTELDMWEEYYDG